MLPAANKAASPELLRHRFWDIALIAYAHASGKGVVWPPTPADTDLEGRRGQVAGQADSYADDSCWAYYWRVENRSAQASMVTPGAPATAAAAAAAAAAAGGRGSELRTALEMYCAQGRSYDEVAFAEFALRAGMQLGEEDAAAGVDGWQGAAEQMLQDEGMFSMLLASPMPNSTFEV